MMLAAVLVVGGLAQTALAQQAVVTAADVQYAATVQLGSSGQAALIWQRFLNGYSTTAQLVEDGKFGPLTSVQAKAWQASRGLVADGVLGTLSRAAAIAQINSNTPASAFPAGCTSTVGYSSVTGMKCDSTTAGTYPTGCTSTVGYSPTTGVKCDSTGTTPAGPLAGTAGEISDVNQLSQYSAEEVGENSENVKVLGFDAKASNEGDVKINSVKLTFDSNGNNAADSDRIADYLDSVSVLMGSKEVGTADMADFTKDSTGVYSKTVSLSDVVIKAGETEEFYVTVTAVSSIDSSDIDSDSWTIALNNIRYEDGSGLVTTVTSADSLLTGNMDYDNAGDGVSIAFVSYSTASDTELKITIASDSPESQVLETSATADTQDVVLLKGKMEVKGTSDVWLDAIPVTFTIANETSIVEVTPTVKLTIDGHSFSESVSDTDTSEVVVFDNLDLTLTAGTTISFTVYADLNDIQASTFDEGTTLMAVLGETETDAATFVGENETGTALADAEKTGTATGKAQAFYSAGIMVTLVGTPTAVITDQGDPAVATSAQKGTYVITFDVTAFGDDMRIDDDADEDTSTFTTVTQLSYSLSGDANVDDSTATNSLTSLTGATHDTESFLVEQNTTERFKLSVTLSPTTSTYSDVKLEGVGWTAGSTDAVGANIYTFNLDEFIAGPIYLVEYD